MSVLIKDFGNDTQCQNPEELKSVLTSKYKNKSVSIVSTKPSGIKHITYVCVQGDGSVIDSYKDNQVELSELFY